MRADHTKLGEQLPPLVEDFGSLTEEMQTKQSLKKDQAIAKTKEMHA